MEVKLRINLENACVYLTGARTELALTLDQAKELYEQLKPFCENKNEFQPYYPINPQNPNDVYYNHNPNTTLPPGPNMFNTTSDTTNKFKVHTNTLGGIDGDQ